MKRMCVRPPRPDLLEWSLLEDEARRKNREQVSELLLVLGSLGYRVEVRGS